MYNQLLSDMGLNISKQPNLEPSSAESAIPEISESRTSNPEKVSQPAQPPKKNSRRLWILIGIAAFVFLLALLVVVAAVAIIFFSR